MNIYHDILNTIVHTLEAIRMQQSMDPWEYSKITCTPSFDPVHADITTNAAIVIASQSLLPYQVLAEAICAKLSSTYPFIKTCDVVAPGFINITVKPVFWQSCLQDLLLQPCLYNAEQYKKLSMHLVYKEAIEYSMKNPCFSVHYAYAKVASLSRYMKEIFPGTDLSIPGLVNVDLSLLTRNEDIAIIKVLSQWSSLNSCDKKTEMADKVASYLFDVAKAFHKYWSYGKKDRVLRIIDPSNKDVSLATYAIAKVVEKVIAQGCNILGIPVVEEIR